MSKFGFLGGTFDPIHVGHLITAQSVKELRNLDEIIFIPAYVSPHKTDLRSAESEHRLEMVRLAIEDIPEFVVSDIEIKAEGISYTVNTLRKLKENYDEIDLIIGYDNIIDFKTWKEPDEILKLANLVVLKRKLTAEPKVKDKYYNSAIFVETPTIEISSSEIRERLKKGLPINFLVPRKVKNYIYENNPYREDN